MPCHDFDRCWLIQPACSIEFLFQHFGHACHTIPPFDRCQGTYPVLSGEESPIQKWGKKSLSLRSLQTLMGRHTLSSHLTAGKSKTDATVMPIPNSVSFFAHFLPQLLAGSAKTSTRLWTDMHCVTSTMSQLHWRSSGIFSAKSKMDILGCRDYNNFTTDYA